MRGFSLLTLRAFGAVVLLTALAAPVTPGAVSAAPTSNERIAGNNRYDTAAQLAMRQSSGPSGTVVVTSGEKFPDALVAGPLSATGERKPLLLVRPDEVPGETREALLSLLPRHIIVIGGEGAISREVFLQLSTMTLTIERISGWDRFETAVEVSKKAFPLSASRVYIAFGNDFPDAVVAGALGSNSEHPVLLVERESIPDVVTTRLRELRPSSIVALGGPSVLSDTALARVREVTGVTPERISGGDRSATSVAASRMMFPSGSSAVYIATGGSFPDALAAGPAAARDDAPVLLVQRACVPEVVRREIDRLGASRLVVVGGTSVVSPEAAELVSCDPAARGTISANVRFSGSGVGYAAYLNLHDGHGNAVAMGVQDDVNAPETGGRPVVHANVFRANPPAGLPAGFDHAYGGLELRPNVTYEFQLDYLDEPQRARLWVDGLPVLEIPVRLRERLFFQTEINVAVEGDSIDATFSDVRIGGHIPGGNGKSNTVEPSGKWNTTSFDFYGLDMEQLDGEVQGADMRGRGTASGVPAGHDWHTVETVNPGEPLAAIGMIAEFWHNK